MPTIEDVVQAEAETALGKSPIAREMINLELVEMTQSDYIQQCPTIYSRRPRDHRIAADGCVYIGRLVD